jgi:glycine cleavage system aminomethyltransferase T
LTSPTDSPRYGKIGIAIVRSGHAAPDAQLEVAAGEGTAPAIVDVLPIYDTNKQRPRA